MSLSTNNRTRKASPMASLSGPTHEAHCVLREEGFDPTKVLLDDLLSVSIPGFEGLLLPILLARRCSAHLVPWTALCVVTRDSRCIDTRDTSKFIKRWHALSRRKQKKFLATHTERRLKVVEVSISICVIIVH